MQRLGRFLAALTLVVLAGCSKTGSTPADAPGNFAVAAGDSQVVVTFTGDPGQTYWLFVAPGTSLDTQNFVGGTGRRLIQGVTSPYIVTGLTNGQTYAFAMNATNNGSPAGPSTQTLTATPRQAGNTWQVNPSLGATNFNAVTFGLNQFIAVGSSGGIYGSTGNATSWTARTSGVSVNLSSIWFASQFSRFIAVGAAGTVVLSSDGVTWTTANVGQSVQLNGVVSTSAGYIAVGAGGVIFVSSDGATWTQRTSPVTTDLLAVTYLNGNVIAVGAGGTILTSPDTQSWTSRVSGTAATLNGLAYFPTAAKYAAVGSAGTIVTSPDVVTWSAATSGTASDLFSVCQLSRFLATGAGGRLLLSDDGVTWTTATSGTASDLRGCTIGLGTYLAVGASGATVLSQ